MSGAAFGRIEQRLTAAIADAEQRARPRSMSPAVGRLAGPDADAAWQAADLATKRAVIRALLVVTVHRSNRARGWRGFDVDSIEIADAWR